MPIEARHPWRGISPIKAAGTTRKLLENLEVRLAQETGSAVGSMIPVPSVQASGGLQSDIRGMRGERHAWSIALRQTGGQDKAEHLPATTRLSDLARIPPRCWPYSAETHRRACFGVLVVSRRRRWAAVTPPEPGSNSASSYTWSFSSGRLRGRSGQISARFGVASTSISTSIRFMASAIYQGRARSLSEAW